MTAEVVNIIGSDVAENEFLRFIETMDLDVDPDGMDDEDKSNLKDARRRIVRAISGGALVINEDGDPVYTPKVGADRNPITFYEPDGGSIMAMDTKKRGHDVAKLYATMADLTKTSVAKFTKMKQRDLSVCQAITVLFLG